MNSLDKMEDYDRLKQDRDELAALVEVMRDALESCAARTFENDPLADEIHKALSITPSDALREIQARAMEELIGVFGGPVNGSDIDSTLRITAAAIRKGE